MTKEEFKKVMPIITAFVEGRTIQYYHRDNGEWRDICEQLYTTDLFNNPSDFRIKTTPKYRPFKNAEECWNEMQEHQPFGWIKEISGHCNFKHITELYSTGIVINGGLKNFIKTYNFAFDKITFADGTPFGMEEEWL